MEDYTDPSSYFSVAVEVSKIYDLYMVLEGVGVTPSDVQIYNSSDFLVALRNAYGV